MRLARPGVRGRLMSGAHSLLVALRRHAAYGAAARKSKGQVIVMYYGRCSEYLMVTSECIVLPEGPCTLAQVIDGLRRRSPEWAYELDDGHMFCEIDGQPGSLTSNIEPGAEIGVFSRKSVFEP